MKKIIKSKKIKYLVFTILGIVLGSSIGITANYLLSASDVEYVDRDNNTMTVQSAITDLYSRAKKGSNQTLTIGNINVDGRKIQISYTGTFVSAGCVYGISESYGNTGTINNNKCEFKGASPKQKIYYKIVAVDNSGAIYEYHDSVETSDLSGPTVYLRTDSIVPTSVRNYFNGTSSSLLGVAYLDPSDLTEGCNELSTLEQTPGTYSGCMRWFIYSTSNDKYTMIADHNIIAKSYYNYEENNESIGTRSKEQIKLDTGRDVTINEIGYDLSQLKNTWNSSIGASNIRLITADEIWNMTGVTGANKFNGIGEGQIKGSNIYKWLFDRTQECETYGCDKEDINIGYWTSTPCSDSSDNAWSVSYNGSLQSLIVSWANRGLRPVIEISNSILNLN